MYVGSKNQGISYQLNGEHEALHAGQVTGMSKG